LRFDWGTALTIAPENRPKVFIGSSTEGLEIARAIAWRLRGTAAIMLWKEEEVFPLGGMTLPSLLEVATQVDFALLVLTADDIVRKRGRRSRSPRDNTIFEAGLFMGRLGPDRTFLIHSHEIRQALPTDLGGLTTAEYRAEADPRAGLAPALRAVRKRLHRLGRRGFVRRELIVQIPPRTVSSGLRVGIAGELDKVGLGAAWRPGSIEMKKAGRDRWRAALWGPEGTSIEYKYTLGPPWNWDHDETGDNRSLVFDPLEPEQVDDTIDGWR
jgi:hypothetical protein